MTLSKTEEERLLKVISPPRSWAEILRLRHMNDGLQSTNDQLNLIIERSQREKQKLLRDLSILAPHAETYIDLKNKIKQNSELLDAWNIFLVKLAEVQAPPPPPPPPPKQEQRQRPKTPFEIDLDILNIKALPRTQKELKKALHDTLFHVHPDHGGSHEATIAAMAAFERLKKAMKAK